MALIERWLLPEGIQELLPPQAIKIEALRRRLLDLHQCWGYQLVMPPLLEHLESLLTGAGNDLDLNTIKVTDQISGHTLGLRADITPQVARIDAHRLRDTGVTRLCYCGSIIHALPAQPLASRNPLQLGAELFGHSGIDSDVEVISLMIETLQTAGVDCHLSLDLGHVGVFNGLMQAANLSPQLQAAYLDILQRKALPELQEFIDKLEIDTQLKAYLATLPKLNGAVEVLAEAEEFFANSPSEVIAAVNYLQLLSKRIESRFPQLEQTVDLSELRGYNYHTGVVFAAYTPAFSQAIAKGGRYDEIGRDFGRARSATGFSADLKTLVELSTDTKDEPKYILAPAVEDETLLNKIRELRGDGKIVVSALPDVEESIHFSSKLVKRDGAWVISNL